MSQQLLIVASVPAYVIATVHAVTNSRGYTPCARAHLYCWAVSVYLRQLTNIPPPPHPLQQVVPPSA